MAKPRPSVSVLTTDRHMISTPTVGLLLLLLQLSLVQDLQAKLYTERLP